MVQPSDLQDQNVLVLGLGASGLAMARWCVRNGAHVTVVDSRENPPQLEALRRELPAARFIWAASDSLGLAEPAFSLICKSPGLTPTAARKLIAMFNIANNVYSTSAKDELSLFSTALADLKTSQGYSPAVLAITGTNGKTTVTSLAGQLVARAGKTVAVAGNIGPTLLDTLSRCLDANELPEVWVIELSSFQLDSVEGFEPTAATVLNVTQDHLDWHGSLEKYAAAKAKVFGKHALMLLNREDTLVMAMLPAPLSLGRAQGKVKDRPRDRDYVTFGGDMPQRPGDFGIEEVNGMVWLVRGDRKSVV